MKKILCSLLIVVILFNFIIINSSYVYAEGAEAGGSPTFIDGFVGEGAQEMPIGADTGDSLINDGQSATGGKKTTFTTTSDNTVAGISILGAVLGYITMVLDIVPIALHFLMTITVLSDGDFINAANTIGGAAGSDVNDLVNSVIGSAYAMFFTIEKAIFNRIPLFDINYFNIYRNTNNVPLGGESTPGTYTIGSGDAEITLVASEANNKVKESVTKWFYICRLLAMVINLGVLIYIGIRMALSTIASDQARYKKMLMSWVESMIILFTLQYIMVILINIGEIFLNICLSLREILIQRGASNFEEDIVETIYFALFRNTGFKIVLYSIMFWFLIFIQAKFFITYLKRFLMVGFLIAISPLITITYSIDKIGDNRAQAFSSWLKEFMVNIFIQPLHAIIYLVFIFTAGEIAAAAPIVALVFLLSLGRVEKMVKSVFSLRDMVSIRSVGNVLKQDK